MLFLMSKLNKRVTAVTEDVQSKLMPILADSKKLTSDVKAFVETNRPKIEQVIESAASISATAKAQTQQVDAALTAFMSRARLQGIRVDEMVTRTLDRVETTTAKVQHTVVSPLRQVNGILQGIGVGVEAFFDKQKRQRNGSPNDEMFI
jgi:ABC-type transporter Mla subunit MlaD